MGANPSSFNKILNKVGEFSPPPAGGEIPRSGEGVLSKEIKFTLKLKW